MADAPNVALTECRTVAGSACALYAVDSEVVWKEPSMETKQAHSKPSSTASTGSR
jgi:hypothetical protein